MTYLRQIAGKTNGNIIKLVNSTEGIITKIERKKLYWYKYTMRQQRSRLTKKVIESKAVGKKEEEDLERFGQIEYRK